jgi:hypothetical protein
MISAVKQVDSGQTHQKAQPFCSRKNGNTLFFQPKLTIGPVNDPYEREADSVSEKVLNMKSNDVIQPLITPVPIQRKCAKCEEEELQRKENSDAETIGDPGLETYVGGLGNSGQPMTNEVRSFFEPRFGYDFSKVKVHTDTVAAKSAQSINALAYTTGNNIVFNKGQYAPDSTNGKKLLAHELTHVVQQSSNLSRKVIQRQFLPQCATLLREPATFSSLSGSAVHAAIVADFATRVPGAISIPIPGASAAPLRSQGLCGQDSTEIIPQIVGGRSGMGFPDLERWTAGVLEVAEIKPASFGCAVDGEAQLFGYVSQGIATDPAQVAWRAAHGIVTVVPMLPTTYNPISINSSNFTILITWCAPGLLVYKVTQRRRERQPRQQPSTQPVPGTLPQTHRQEESNWELVRRFIEQLITLGGNVEEAITQFLTENPHLIEFIIWTGIGGIVATILEDIATAGAGIADDPFIIAICAQMIRIARGMRALTLSPG